MSFNIAADDENDVMSEINMTPLVDVMLVLLVVFMITMPVIQHSVKLDLPQARNQVNNLSLPHINLTIYENGKVQWNGQPVSSNELAVKISGAAAQSPQPELHLYAERKTSYEKVAQVMAIVQSGGLSRIGFITKAQ